MMNRLFTQLLTSATFLVIVTCSPQPSSAPAPAAPVLEPVSASNGRLRVEVDPRIEPMTAIQILAGYPVLTPHETAYRADPLAYFEGSAGHPVVEQLGVMFEDGFGFDAFPKAFASMSPIPELELGSVAVEVQERAGGGADRWSGWRPLRLTSSKRRTSGHSIARTREHTG